MIGWFVSYQIWLYIISSESQSEVGTLEQELKRSSEVVLDLERRLRLLEDEKSAFEKVCIFKAVFRYFYFSSIEINSSTYLHFKMFNNVFSDHVINLVNVNISEKISQELMLPESQ